MSFARAGILVWHQDHQDAPVSDLRSPRVSPCSVEVTVRTFDAGARASSASLIWLLQNGHCHQDSKPQVRGP